MSANRLRRALTALGLCSVLALGAAACGDDDETSSSGSSGKGKSIKVGLVTDIGGLNDRSFNQLANAGLTRAEKELGIDGRVLTSKSNSDYVPSLSTLAQQRYDLIIGVGFLMANATDTVATKFPKQKFALIDVPQASLEHKPKNIGGLLFKEQESGYQAGYLAGLYAKEEGIKTISSVGGQEIPPVVHYIAGYQAGAKAANPSIETINGYSQDFVDPAKCKEEALNQIQRGSKIVFQVAGQCGLGALDAAKERGVKAIGVDADQGYLGDHILTSAMKRVDTAVFEAIKEAQTDSFKIGTDQVFSLADDGVKLGRFSAAAKPFQAKVDAESKKIVDGSVTPPDALK